MFNVTANEVEGALPMDMPEFLTHVPNGFFEAPSKNPWWIVSIKVSFFIFLKKGSFSDGLKVSSCQALLVTQVELIEE
jgi:hypothetical protein